MVFVSFEDRKHLLASPEGGPAPSLDLDRLGKSEADLPKFGEVRIVVRIPAGMSQSAYLRTMVGA
jgi:hypothetical protein